MIIQQKAAIPIAGCGINGISHRFAQGSYITYYVLRIAYCVLRIAYCVLRIAYCVLRIAYCVLRMAYGV